MREEVGSKGMSETRAEDMTPLTERKSINSSFFFLRRGVSAMRGCSQVSNLKSTSQLMKDYYRYIISRREKGRKERWGGGCLGVEDWQKKRETWTLREMDAEGERE